jgi:MerR family transcriptional regulator, copper efflux regulator
VTAKRSTPPIACTLDAQDMSQRLAAWQEALAAVADRVPIPGGLRLTFSAEARPAELVELAAAEHDCCRFFAFSVTVDDRGVALEVTAPQEAQDLVHAVFGAA